MYVCMHILGRLSQPVSEQFETLKKIKTRLAFMVWIERYKKR